MRLLFVTFLLLTTPAAAQPVIPDTAMGHTLSDYLAAFNSGDRARIEAFSTAHHFSQKIENQVSFFRQTGGWTLLKIESSDDTSITALVREKESDTVARAIFKKTGTPAAPKLSINLRGGVEIPEYAVPRLSGPEAIQTLEAHTQQQAARDRLSGVMLVARNGKILYRKAWGQADRETGAAATLDTKFRMGSMNKMFTAVAALQLVAAKKLSLDGTVGGYLPDYPNRDIAQKVTIRQLLTHTGGTGDFFGPEFDARRLSLKTHGDYIALFGARAPRFAPGSRDGYSNYGFLLLGAIIEKVSGQTYYDYVDQHIFAPAGMTNTGSLPEEETVPGRARAYMWKDRWVSAADTLPYRGTSAGGGYTTAGDLLKFAQALQSEKLLPGRFVADATIPHDHGGQTGYGFDVSGSGLLQHYGHSGGASGQNGDLQIYPALGYVLIALSNYDPPTATNLTGFYANRMPLN